MKKIISLFFLLFLSSCGSLGIIPTGCKSDGLWGPVPELGKELDEVEFSEDFLVLNVDREVRLKEFLKEKGLNCSEIKKMRVEIKSVFFIKRELSVFVSK